MKTIHSVPWIILAVPLILASEDVLYLKGLEGESVQFVCLSEETSIHPIGLYLKRKCMGPAREVMFFSEFGKAVGNHEDKERIWVQGDLSTNPVNVTISELQHRDSGLYYCEFVYAGETTDRFISGKEDFFLFVDTMTASAGHQCNCSSYPPLLYAISAAVGLLLLILLGMAASHCGKPFKRQKPQAQVPIYEEMVGGRPANGKGPRCHLDALQQEEADSVYINPHIKHRQENHYVNPREKQLVPETSATVMEGNQ